jgi:hypothetical protein
MPTCLPSNAYDRNAGNSLSASKMLGEAWPPDFILHGRAARPQACVPFSLVLLRRCNQSADQFRMQPSPYYPARSRRKQIGRILAVAAMPVMLWVTTERKLKA